MHSGELKQQFERDDETGFRELSQLLHLTTTELQIPPSDPDTTLPELDNTRPLVQLTNAAIKYGDVVIFENLCLLYTSPSPRDQRGSRMPSSA